MEKEELGQEPKKEAYEIAKHLTGAPAISNEEDLKKAFETYSRSQWSREFGYEFDSIKPKAFEGGEAATLVRNCAFACLPEADADTTKKHLAHFITDQFLEIINGNVKDEGIKEWASNDLLAGILSTIDQGSPGQWTARKFDNEYAGSIDPSLNPIRGHVLYYVFQLTKTTDKGEEVTVKYIFCQGIFYEAIPIIDLYNELGKNLRKYISNYPPPPKTPIDPEELRNILLWFGRQEFLRKFGFQWKDDLKDKDIPGYQSKMVPRVYNILFDFSTTSPERQLIEDRFGRAAFKKDGWEFPWKPKDPKYKPIQEVLYNDVCDRIEMLTQPEGGIPKKENVWYQIADTVRYPPDPDTPTSFVRQFFVFVYVLGKKDTGPQATVERLFVNYLSVFCGEYAKEPLVSSSSPVSFNN
jgi:hypothetical protein